MIDLARREKAQAFGLGRLRSPAGGSRSPGHRDLAHGPRPPEKDGEQLRQALPRGRQRPPGRAPRREAVRRRRAGAANACRTVPRDTGQRSASSCSKAAGAGHVATAAMASSMSSRHLPVQRRRPGTRAPPGLRREDWASPSGPRRHHLRKLEEAGTSLVVLAADSKSTGGKGNHHDRHAATRAPAPGTYILDPNRTPSAPTSRPCSASWRCTAPSGFIRAGQHRRRSRRLERPGQRRGSTPQATQNGTQRRLGPLPNAKAYPEITFTGQGARRDGDGWWCRVRDRARRRRAREVRLSDVRKPGSRFRATARLDRTSFGVTKKKGVVGAVRQPGRRGGGLGQASSRSAWVRRARPVARQWEILTTGAAGRGAVQGAASGRPGRRLPPGSAGHPVLAGPVAMSSGESPFFPSVHYHACTLTPPFALTWIHLSLNQVTLCKIHDCSELASQYISHSAIHLHSILPAALIEWHTLP